MGGVTVFGQDVRYLLITLSFHCIILELSFTLEYHTQDFLYRLYIHFSFLQSFSGAGFLLGVVGCSRYFRGASYVCK